MTFTTRARGLLAAALLLAAPAAPAHAQRGRGAPDPRQQMPIQVTGGGTDLFRALFDREGIEPVSQRDVDFGRVVPSANLIVVVIGHTSGNDWDSGLALARRTVEAGGAALVATDGWVRLFEHDNNPNGNNPVGWFSGAVVTADRRDEDHTLGGWANCPFAVPVSPDELNIPAARQGRVWGVFRGLVKVATNYPTSIDLTRFREEYRHPLARFPASVRVDGAQPDRPPLLAVGGDGPARRDGTPGYSFLAVADGSIFINQMLMEEGTDNLEFALNVVEYLQGPDKSRKRCVFFENGQVKERFDGLRDAVRPPKPPVPPGAMPDLGQLFGKNQDKIVELLDGLVDQAQTKDALHNVLVGPPGSEQERNRFAAWFDGFLLLLALLIGRLLLARFWRMRAPQDVPLPPATGAGVASTGPPGVFDRRQKEMVRRNNVYEPVRHLVREFFASVGAPPNPGPRMPAVEVTRAVRKPDSLRHALRDMWRLAYGPPVALTAQRWFELEPYFERLKQAHADGKWYFAT